MDAITTIDFPLELPVVRKGDEWLARAGDRDLRLSNLDKVYWPENGITKGDLVTYYFNAALAMLPHVADRPLTLKRQPDGVAGPYWYEKDAPSYTPDWMPRIDVEAQTEDRTIRFVTAREVVDVLWLANIGCIEFHPLHAKGPEQHNPTFAFFDLDPFPPADIETAKHVARLLKTSLDRLDLNSYIKTSGGTGLHVYVPLDGSHHFDEVRAFADALCRLIHRADPDTTTMEWAIDKRAGKVFLDANMNRPIASAAAPYSVRSKWDAPVSMPFTWDELDSIDPYGWTISTALPRMQGNQDPFLPLTTGEGHSLDGAMEALGIGRSQR